ncbi:MAG: hypothetical protein MZV70_01115 [Desulfobacterales bacterium]|nr:hypothetical protein [Desulfobacterales bacterium]
MPARPPPGLVGQRCWSGQPAHRRPFRSVRGALPEHRRPVAPANPEGRFLKIQFIDGDRHIVTADMNGAPEDVPACRHAFLSACQTDRGEASSP